MFAHDLFSCHTLELLGGAEVRAAVPGCCLCQRGRSAAFLGPVTSFLLNHWVLGMEADLPCLEGIARRGFMESGLQAEAAAPVLGFL